MAESELARVAVRAPPFWDSDPELWFMMLESQLKLSGITADETKFHTVIAALDAKVLSCVADIIRAPPIEKMYDTIKGRILGSFSQSEGSKLRVLLQELQLGDKRPSQLLREMKNLAAGKVGDDVLQSIWMQRLPVSIQQILSVSSDNLDGLALIADKVNEVSSFTPVLSAVTSEKSDMQSLRDEIAELRAEFGRVSRPRFRRFGKGKRDDSHSKTRSTSRTSNSAAGKLCWYHRRFADKALKCVGSCSFQGN